jgi:hypothetical protein
MEFLVVHHALDKNGNEFQDCWPVKANRKPTDSEIRFLLPIRGVLEDSPIDNITVTEISWDVLRLSE